MIVDVNKLRKCVVLPSELVVEMSQQTVTGVEVVDTWSANKWYDNKYNLCFGEKGDELFLKKASNECKKCDGECCKNLLEHQIRIYMTEFERGVVMSTRKGQLKAERINIDGNIFYVIDVDYNGDCVYLDKEKGCEFGEDRPLWCKMFFCERIFGGEYKHAKKNK